MAAVPSLTHLAIWPWVINADANTELEVAKLANEVWKNEKEKMMAEIMEETKRHAGENNVAQTAFFAHIQCLANRQEEDYKRARAQDGQCKSEAESWLRKMLEYDAKDVTSVWKGRLLIELSTTPLMLEQMRTSIYEKDAEINITKRDLKQHKAEQKQQMLKFQASTSHLKHVLKKNEGVRNRMIKEMDRLQKDLQTAVQKSAQKIENTKKQNGQKAVQKIMNKTKKPVKK